MKKWGLLYIIISIVSCQNKERRPACDKFRTGKFWYRGFTIERSDSIQVEKNSSGLVITKRIHWVNECEYQLTFISGRQKDTLADDKIIIYERRDDTQKIKIVETAKDYYIFKSVDSKGEIYEGKVSVLKVGGFKSIGDLFPAEK